MPIDRSQRTTILEVGHGLASAVIGFAIATAFRSEQALALTALLLAIAVPVLFRSMTAGLAAFSAVAIYGLLFDSLRSGVRAVAFAIIAAAVCVIAALLEKRQSAALVPIGRSAPLVTERTAVSLITLFGVPLLAFTIFTNISDVVIRLLSVPSPLQPLILLLALAVIHYRRALRPGFVLQHPLTLALIAYCVLLFCSGVWAQDLRLVDEKTTDAAKNLTIFLVVAAAATSWQSIRRVVIALAIAAALLSALTIRQTITGKPSQYFGLARTEVAHIYDEVTHLRPSGPLGDPNFYAQVLLLVVPVALFAGFGEKRKRVRWTLFISAAVTSAAALLTFSRGAMLALAVAAAMAVAFLRLPLRRLAPILLVLLVGFLMLPRSLAERFITIEALVPGTGMAVDSSIQKRQLLLGTAANMFEDHLAAGVGAGNFTRHYDRYSQQTGSAAPQYEEPGTRQYPHNLYLEIGAETGLLGLAVLAFAVLASFASLVRARKAFRAGGDTAGARLVEGLAISLTTYLVTSLFLHAAFQRYLFLMLALIPAAVRLAPRRRDEELVDERLLADGPVEVRT